MFRNNKLTIDRNSSGIPKIIAKSEKDMYYGLGYCHVVDRGMQMIMMKILGSGTASEYLNSDDEMLEIDRFFRKMNWSKNLTTEINKLSKSENELLEYYCEGVNDAFKKHKPWELNLLLGFKNFNWEKEDIALIGKMIGFLSLAQSQGEIERLFIEMVQKGIHKDLLDELFPNILDNYDPEIIKKIQLGEKNVPDAVKWNLSSHSFMASNNWVISGKKTKSGSPILANDPHLEINRLPSVWYEIIAEYDDKFAWGGTMPGVPIFLIGRNKHLSWGTTYSFMDAHDSWIEKCKNGKYFKDGNWVDFKIRIETIKRKKKDPVEITFYENEHGILDGDPFIEGYYLSSKWASNSSGAITISSGLKILQTDDVEKGMQTIGKLEMAFSWVLADTNGNIGLQMSGKMPIRKNDWCGFVPMLGWESQNDWKGIHPIENLPRVYNPTKEFIVTTNNNLNSLGIENPINMPMGEYRADRIKHLIQKTSSHTIEDSKNIQYDVYSLQAESFMKIIMPLLPQSNEINNSNQNYSKNLNVIKNWDLCYDINSKGAFLFEMIYRSLYHEVFGEVLGVDLMKFLQNETGIIIDFYSNFDTILLSENSKWFLKQNRDTIFKKAIENALNMEAKEWGEVNFISLTNILLGNHFPKFFGFDKGPIPLAGGRATVNQGQVYKSAGRKISFAPSIRIITDMSKKTVFTNIIGGVSDRRFSKLYNNNTYNWQNKIYTEIKF